MLCSGILLNFKKDKFQSTNPQNNCVFEEITEEEYDSLNPTLQNQYNFKKRKDNYINIIKKNINELEKNLTNYKKEKEELNCEQNNSPHPCSTIDRNIDTLLNSLIINKKKLIMNTCECKNCASYTNTDRNIKCLNECTQDEINKRLILLLKSEGNTDLLEYYRKINIISEEQENNIPEPENNIIKQENNNNNLARNINTTKQENNNNLASNINTTEPDIENIIAGNNNSINSIIGLENNNISGLAEINNNNNLNDGINIDVSGINNNRPQYGLDDYKYKDGINLGHNKGKNASTLGYADFLPNMDYDLYLARNRADGMEKTHFDDRYYNNTQSLNPYLTGYSGENGSQIKPLVTQSDINGVMNIFAPKIIVNPEPDLYGGMF